MGSEPADWEDWFGLHGASVDGRYQVERVVGSGSFGIVYRATETGVMPRLVALKCLKVPPSLDERGRESFLRQLRREGLILQGLSSRHAGITQAHGAGTIMTRRGWVPYLVLEWLQGKSLESFLQERRGVGIPLADAIELLEQAAHALAAAHELGVAHRDIKPANMFVVDIGKKPRTKVLDFGVAKVFGDHFPLDHDHTTSPGAPTGAFTPAYGAPEQFDPKLGKTGPHTDVFALALVLIELVTGKPALTGASLYALFECSLSRETRPSLRGCAATELSAAVDRVLVDRVIDTALAVDIEKRYEDVGAFWRALSRAALHYTMDRSDAGDLALSSTAPAGTETPGASEVRAAFVYAEEDDDIARDLEYELKPLLSDTIVSWHPRSFGRSEGPGGAGLNLDRIQILVVLITKTLIESGYCETAELKRAIERHARSDFRVVPLMVRRTTGWWRSPFRDMVVVPRFGVPITQWQNRKLAWRDVAESIRVISREVTGAVPSRAPPPPERTYKLHEVFKKSDVPTVTFVPTDGYRELKGCLAEPGRGVVVEGPSGVGKTTALRRAVQELIDEADGDGPREFVLLNPWRAADREKIAKIASWHVRGTVAIDNFHVLDASVAASVVNYVKLLADEQETERKVVIVGIPGSRQSFADFGIDGPRRFDQIRFGRAKTEEILLMIEKGEKALGVSIARKSDIAVAAAGSISIAQLICHWICQAAWIDKTQAAHKVVTWNVHDVLERILGSLRGIFSRFIVEFGRLGDERDTTAVKILKELPAVEDGLLSLRVLQGRVDPSFARGIKNLLVRGDIASFYKKVDSDRDKLLYYDVKRQTLAVEDPQLSFYLAHERLVELTTAAGRGAVVERARIVVHHSPHDAHPKKDWLSPITAKLRALTDIDADVVSAAITVGPTLLDDVRHMVGEATVVVLLVTQDYVRSFRSIDELRKVLHEGAHPKLAIFPLVHEQGHGVDALCKSFAPVATAPIASLGGAERDAVYSRLLDSARTHIHKSRISDE